MIRGKIEIPGKYWANAAVWDYARKGERVPVWIDAKDGDFYVCYLLGREGRGCGRAHWLSARVLYRRDEGWGKR